MNFKEELVRKTEEVEGVIASYLPCEEGQATELVRAMNYSMLAGGKRLRPILMKECFQLFGGSGKAIEAFMAAIEMIHTHSLIHDDLPALDNDALRRGKPTTHVAFGEDVAILAGDALLNYAYECAMTVFTLEGIVYDRVARALSLLANRTGIYGMLGGQSVDVKNENKPLSVEVLEYIYAYKTSALIEASMGIGAILAGASEQEIMRVTQMANKIGLAFQIQDDILDVTSTEEELGKPICSDEKNMKTTYVTLYGIAKAREYVKILSEEAIEILNEFKGHNEFLNALITYLITRVK